MSDQYARLTFNLSAKCNFGDTLGLKVKIVDGAIMFQPAVEKYCLPFIPSDCGPLIDIDSENILSKAFMQALHEAGCSAEEPYFVLVNALKGWFSLKHYPFDHQPQKNIPYFRVWILRWTPHLVSERLDLRSWGIARASLLKAAANILRFESNPPHGKMPEIVAQSYDIITSLQQVLGEIARLVKKPSIHQMDDDPSPTLYRKMR